MNDANGSEEGQDDQDESYHLLEGNIEDALISSKIQQQCEVQVSPKHDSLKYCASNTQDTNNLKDDATSIEHKAKKLFLQGVEHEQNGKFYKAIQSYKQAVQLVPDIESRLYESHKGESQEKFESNGKQETKERDKQCVDDNDTNDSSDEDDSTDDLIVKLTKVVYRNKCVCFPSFEQKTTHISALPMEILMYILRWVVSSELDLRSLDMFSGVCRGFYVSARDEDIWRLACNRVWGVECGALKPQYDSWREMYIQRPRLRYNGCYISKTSYIRHGENSFQDQFYRPWHLVEYFRYLRFFPDGKVLMLTSSDEMQNSVNSLKHRTPKNSSILIGHYGLDGDHVTLVLKKQEVKGNRRRRREPSHDVGEHTFHLEFEIQNHYKRANSQLNWVSYSICSLYKDGLESRACLNLGGRYTPFRFSRVKSYALESEKPLQ